MTAAQALVVLAISVAGARVSHAGPSEAERLYAIGQQAYDQHRYDDAIAAWERSYELSQLAALQFNIGQAYRLRARTGDCEHATAHYRTFIELDRGSPKRALAQSLLAELGTCSASLALTGTSAVPDSPPALHGRGKRLAGYLLVGGGAALAATGAGFGARAQTIGNEVTSACRAGCDWGIESVRQREAERDQTAQWVLYGAGAAAAITGVALWALGTHERASMVAVVPRAGGATVSWSRWW